MSLSLGPVKPHVRNAALQIQSQFGINRMGGFASSGHAPNSDHYRGLALDVMTRNGTPIAEWAKANWQALGVTYVIWNRRIWSVARNREGWRAYFGTSPHTDHVHISFSAVPGTGQIASIAPGVMIGESLGWLTEGGTWARVGAFAGGIGILVVIVYMLVRRIL